MRVSLPIAVALFAGCGFADTSSEEAVPPIESSSFDGVGPAQQAYVKASNTGAIDFFGSAVALSADGSTLAVGAHAEDSPATGVNGQQDDGDAPARDSGAVYVFSRKEGIWVQEAYLKASNTGAGDSFGGSVALSADGSTLAVGALGEASAAKGIDSGQRDDSAPLAGAVYVFTRSGADWSQQAYVKASNPDAGDRFGHSVALSADGSILAVGAIGEDSQAEGFDGDQADNRAPDAGAVYVFGRSDTTWKQLAYVKAPNTDAGDSFGGSVALSGNGLTLAVGALGEASAATGVGIGTGGDRGLDDTAASSGAVYLFRRGVRWTQWAYVKASNTDAGDSFGYSVALSGDGSTLLVGAPWEASAATGIDGDQRDNSMLMAGAAYVFARSGMTWSQQAYIKASNTDGRDRFGGAVALSGDGSTLLVGAPWEASAATGIDGDQRDNSMLMAGAAYLLARQGAGWSYTYVKASNTGDVDVFGSAVALSDDASTLAAGAPREASRATGIDGDQQDNSAIAAGAVYVFGGFTGLVR